MLLRRGGEKMPVVEILEHFPATESYEVGKQYDITNPAALIAEGKVKLVEEQAQTPVEPVSAAEQPVTEGSQPEGAEQAPVEAPAEAPVEEAPVETPAEEPTPEPVSEAAPVEEAPVEAPVAEEAPTETPAETETVE